MHFISPRVFFLSLKVAHLCLVGVAWSDRLKGQLNIAFAGFAYINCDQCTTCRTPHIIVFCSLNSHQHCWMVERWDSQNGRGHSMSIELKPSWWPLQIFMKFSPPGLIIELWKASKFQLPGSNHFHDMGPLSFGDFYPMPNLKKNAFLRSYLSELIITEK